MHATKHTHADNAARSVGRVSWIAKGQVAGTSSAALRRAMAFGDIPLPIQRGFPYAQEKYDESIDST
jgi:hypothetical protein